MPKVPFEGGHLKVTVQRDGRVTIVALLSGKLFKEGDRWVSHCPALDLSTCADTESEILNNTKEAIELWFKGCLEMGTLDKALRELNWERKEQIDLDGLAKHKSPKTPPPFIIEGMRRRAQGWEARAVSSV